MGKMCSCLVLQGQNTCELEICEDNLVDGLISFELIGEEVSFSLRHEDSSLKYNYTETKFGEELSPEDSCACIFEEEVPNLCNSGEFSPCLDPRIVVYDLQSIFQFNVTPTAVPSTPALTQTNAPTEGSESAAPVLDMSIAFGAFAAVLLVAVLLILVLLVTMRRKQIQNDRRASRESREKLNLVSFIEPEETQYPMPVQLTRKPPAVQPRPVRRPRRILQKLSTYRAYSQFSDGDSELTKLLKTRLSVRSAKPLSEFSASNTMSVNVDQYKNGISLEERNRFKKLKNESVRLSANIARLDQLIGLGVSRKSTTRASIVPAQRASTEDLESKLMRRTSETSVKKKKKKKSEKPGKKLKNKKTSTARALWRASAKELVKKVCEKLGKEVLSAAQVEFLEIHKSEKLNKLQESNLSAFSEDSGSVNLRLGMELETFLYSLVTGLNTWFSNDSTDEVVGIRSLIISLLYLNKVKKKEPNFLLTVYNVHKLFAVMMLLAAKFSEDVVITNGYWSDITGIELIELNELEDKLCFSSGFDFYVNRNELYELYEEFGLKDFTTYSDMPDRLSFRPGSVTYAESFASF